MKMHYCISNYIYNSYIRSVPIYTVYIQYPAGRTIRLLYAYIKYILRVDRPHVHLAHLVVIVVAVAAAFAVHLDVATEEGLLDGGAAALADVDERAVQHRAVVRRRHRRADLRERMRRAAPAHVARR